MAHLFRNATVWNATMRSLGIRGLVLWVSSVRPRSHKSVALHIRIARVHTHYMHTQTRIHTYTLPCACTHLNKTHAKTPASKHIVIGVAHLDMLYTFVPCFRTHARTHARHLCICLMSFNVFARGRCNVPGADDQSKRSEPPSMH